jgi:hypothetical protein
MDQGRREPNGTGFSAGTDGAGPGRAVPSAPDGLPGLAKQRSLSLETASRQARYEFLDRVRRETGAACILTGHTADDNARPS